MTGKKLNIIGELINNSYARARKAFTDRSPKEYANLAKIQADLGAQYLTLNPDDCSRAAKYFVELLVTKAGRRLDQIIIDPGLAPVGADTYGLVNIGLDAMRMIQADADLRGVHFIVGLSNFAWGTPKGVRE